MERVSPLTSFHPWHTNSKVSPADILLSNNTLSQFILKSIIHSSRRATGLFYQAKLALIKLQASQAEEKKKLDELG
jgi:hypothetical protein